MGDKIWSLYEEVSRDLEIVGRHELELAGHDFSKFHCLLFAGFPNNGTVKRKEVARPG